MKVAEQYFYVVQFIILYKVDLTFKSLGENLECDHLYESYRAVLSYSAICLRFFLSRNLTKFQTLNFH